MKEKLKELAVALDFDKVKSDALLVEENANETRKFEQLHVEFQKRLQAERMQLEQSHSLKI